MKTWSFRKSERREAVPITQQFFAQNIGVVGNVSDQAHVESSQAASVEGDIDFGQLKDFLEQTRQALPMLPEDTRHQVGPLVEEVEGELAKDEPNKKKIRELLSSTKSVCEGAAGNLTAQGIVSLVNNLF